MPQLVFLSLLVRYFKDSGLVPWSRQRTFVSPWFLRCFCRSATGKPYCPFHVFSQWFSQSIGRTWCYCMDRWLRTACRV